VTEPKVAIATTTIHVPKVLELLHAHDRDVAIFVAGDLKTPEPQCADFVNKLGGNAYYLSVERQKSLKYACSDPIGWNCIQRRNIATLEALKWGADIVIHHDDDNVPMNESYFDDFVSVLHHPFNGLRAISTGEWFDPGALLIPQVPHRGIPHEVTGTSHVQHVVGAKVGVAAGLCLGDPDIHAVTRMCAHPAVFSVNELGTAGVVVDPSIKTVFNSQNTAFIRELAPAMCMLPNLGRYDDIFASLICRRVMRDRNLHVHFGRPYAWQSRNPHNLMADLKAEMFGMEHIVRFADLLDGTNNLGITLMDHVSSIAQELIRADWFPANAAHALIAWTDDIETVMK